MKKLLSVVPFLLLGLLALMVPASAWATAPASFADVLGVSGLIDSSPIYLLAGLTLPVLGIILIWRKLTKGTNRS